MNDFNAYCMNFLIMNIFIRVMAIIALIISVCFFMYPAVYWWNHDSLNEMQLLKATWQYTIVGLIFMFVSLKISEQKEGGETKEGLE